MKKGTIEKIIVTTLLLSVLLPGRQASAEPVVEADDPVNTATSISISPVSKILQLEPDHVYEDVFKVTNNGPNPMTFEVSASPYSYSLSEAYGEYRLGFNNENAYTQITRWITFADKDGNFVKNPEFTAAPGESVIVTYHISTPSSLPGGGQYAALFAHTKSQPSAQGAIRMEASAGMIVYGRSTGETVMGGEISGMAIDFPGRASGAQGDSGTESHATSAISASARVKNTGNVDFMAVGKMTVEGVFGTKLYETPADGARISVIPESELAVSDTWDEIPYCGFYRVTWTVDAAGQSETISRMIAILPAPVIIGIILLLTALTIWIILIARRRKAHRSRLAV